MFHPMLVIVFRGGLALTLGGGAYGLRSRTKMVRAVVGLRSLADGSGRAAAGQFTGALDAPRPVAVAGRRTSSRIQRRPQAEAGLPMIGASAAYLLLGTKMCLRPALAVSEGVRQGPEGRPFQRASSGCFAIR